MAELTSNASPPDCMFGKKAGVNKGKSDDATPAGNSPQNSCPQPFMTIVFVRYLDHVLYNRTSALAMKPQTRETIGWLIYECELYIIITWDRDADPPTLHGGDAKASGLVLLKSDIIALEKLAVKTKISHENSNWVLNSPERTVKDEYAFRPSERKTHSLNPKGEKKP